MASCAPELPAPQLESVEPSWGYNGEETAVRLLGENLYPRVQARGGESVELDHEFQIYLNGPESVELGGVDFVNYQTIDSRVPSGLTPGDYDLLLQGPAGDISQLQSAFTVTDTRADHLEMAVDGVTYEVNALARIEIALLDPEGGDVASPLAVRVEIAGQEGASGVRFEPTMADQQSLEKGVGITGTLGANGMAYVALTSSVSEELWITVSADDEGSVVRSDTQFIAFTAGDVSRVQVEFLEDMSSRTAGEIFPLQITLLDAWENQTEGVTAGLTITEACGDSATRFEHTIQLVDSETVKDAYATGSTNTAACPENRFYVAGTAAGSFVDGQSEPFMLGPGEASSLELQSSPSEVQAGGDPLFVRVEAQDNFDNPVPEFSESLLLTDDIGGLDPGGGMGEQECTAFNAGVSFCQAWPWKSADEVTLRAVSETGLSGESDPIRVLAGAANSLVVGISASTVEAGEVYSMTLRVLDVYGNPIVLDSAGMDAPEFQDLYGATTCAWSASVVPEGSEEYACVSTTADEGMEIEVTIPSIGVGGRSDVLEVTNADLSQAEVDISGVSSLVAGESIPVDIQTFDTYGNPYRVQSISSISLYDQSGELGGDALALDSMGRASGSPMLTRAMTGNALVARDGLNTLGTSPAFDVNASSMDAFVVEAESTWVWVDAPLNVTLTAVDSFGNTVPDYSDEVLLSSGAGLGDSLTVDDFESGIADIVFECSEAGLNDSLIATDGVYSGSSSDLDVLADCEEGPDVEVLVGGSTELVQCLVSGSTPLISVDASGSIEGSSPMVAWHFDLGDASGWARSTVPTTTHSWGEEGSRNVVVIGADESACGSEAEARLWTAVDDGEPAGPVLIETDADSMIAGSSISGRLAVDIAATDCTGDLSAGGTVLLRVNIGEIDASPVEISESGAGLELVLDGDGVGTFEWSVESQSFAGDGTLFVGVESGSAYGQENVSVTGDSVPPTVLDVRPSGTLGGLFDEAEIIFSEAMLSTSLHTGTVEITDPDGNVVDVDSVQLSADGTELLMALAQEGSGTDGVWELGLSSNIRDDSGNRLDGRYSGSASAFSIEFGDVLDDSQDVSSCSASPSVFHPDGDDGLAEEADGTVLTYAAPTMPGWWEIDIMDDAGERVWLVRVPASSASSSYEWEGRGLDGIISASGGYIGVVTALDNYWNAGASCAIEFDLSQHLEAQD